MKLESHNVDVSDLADMYALYCATASPPWYALSFAATEYLLGLQWESAVDLGSGWTSYALRAWPERRVTTVDTDREWANCTMQFLETVHRPAKIFLWDDVKPEPHELVVFDLGGGQRDKQLDKAAEWLAPGGTMYLDDAHRDAYRETVIQWAVSRGWRTQILKQETLDPYGRYGMLVHRDG